MSRQDRNGVRTAQDLERKYNIGKLEKAVKLHEELINKTNSTLEDFIYATVGSLKTFEGIKDGNIMTYYYSGVPTIENYPASAWTEEEYENHTDDLYYDKDTGSAYVFSLLEDGTYGWERTNANYIIKALAMANSAYDTADGKRRIFTDTPVPPYENGDMWVKAGEIYMCQVSKGASEVYEEDDFIVATKYTDNTVAEQVGEELKVLKGTVLLIEESLNRFKVEIDDLDAETSSSIDFIKDELLLKIEGVTTELATVNDDLQAKFNIITKYFTFDVDGLTIGQVDNPYKVIIDNDRYSMTVNGIEVLWLDGNGRAHIPELTITKQLMLLGYLIDLDSYGDLNCEYIGGVE